MDHVERVAHRPPEPVERVDNDDVPVAGVLEHGAQAGSVDRRARLLVDVDPITLHASAGQSLDLSIEILLGRRHPRVTEIHGTWPYRRSLSYAQSKTLFRDQPVEPPRARSTAQAIRAPRSVPVPRKRDAHSAAGRASSPIALRPARDRGRDRRKRPRPAFEPERDPSVRAISR